MYQGFYNLTSGMLTQSRNLNVISNNMVNIQTPGYKRDKMVSTTFQEEMLYRTGKRYKEGAEPLATTSKIRAADQTYVNYEQGSFETTDGIFDFALASPGFFCVDTPMGTRYTRNGSFMVDDEGYLALNGLGRVQGTDGPIQIDNENFTVDSSGHIKVTEVSGGGLRMRRPRWRHGIWEPSGSWILRTMSSCIKRITGCFLMRARHRMWSLLLSYGRQRRSTMSICWR